MTTRAPRLGSVVAVGLAAVLLAGPLALPSHGQESARGITLFPEPRAERVPPRAEIPPLPEPVYIAAATAATLTTIPHKMASCLSSDVLGFLIGSVLRTAAWWATVGDQAGSGEWLQRAGEAIVERGCPSSMVVSPEDLKRRQPPVESPAPTLQAR